MNARPGVEFVARMAAIQDGTVQAQTMEAVIQGVGDGALDRAAQDREPDMQQIMQSR